MEDRLLVTNSPNSLPERFVADGPADTPGFVPFGGDHLSRVRITTNLKRPTR